jgi:hypothetical protein
MHLFLIIVRRSLGFALAITLALSSAQGSEPTIGSSREFWVWDLSVMPPAHRKAEATLRAVGPRSLIYVEEKFWEKTITADFVGRLLQNLEHKTPAGSYDSSQGIIPIQETLFAPLPNKFGEARAIVLFAELGQYKNYRFDGFFNPFDQMPESEAVAQGQHSNEGNVIYINGFRESETYTTGVISHELNHLLGHQFTGGVQDLWFGETLAEMAMLVTGYYSDQGHADRFAKAPQDFPLVSHNYVQYGPQLLFASYLLDIMGDKILGGLPYLTRTSGNGRSSVEDFLRFNTSRPTSFDVMFSNFIGYVFENSGNLLPITLVNGGSEGLVMPEIPAYATLESFPANLEGKIMPYTYLAIDLPSAIPLTAVIQVEALREGAKVGSCAQNGTVLWKPIHPKRIAIYSVGCEHKEAADQLQFRLSVFDKPLLLPGSARKLNP